MRDLLHIAAPADKLAASLDSLRALQADGRRVFRTNELAATDQQRLLRNGFLERAMQGWLYSASPAGIGGESTPWFASFWQFCAAYCTHRFGSQWHLSAEQSLLLTSGDGAVPKQVVVYAPKATNQTVELPFATSIYNLKRAMPQSGELVETDGVVHFAPTAALVRVPAAFFARQPVTAQVALEGVRDAAELLRPLLSGGHSVIAGRLVGALRRIDRSDLANDVRRGMEAADFDVREVDPFDDEVRFASLGPASTPLARRLRALWAQHREVVVARFPEPPGLPDDATPFLTAVDATYASDAYNSLSIEGYQVDEALIERVRSGDWRPHVDARDEADRDALAARGYWQAFQAVRGDVASVLSGADAGALTRAEHGEWYRQLFQPFVAAGVLEATALAGYRNNAVYLRGSRHVPPSHDHVADATQAVFDLITAEPHPAARAVLGHWLFGYVHPFPDGNGRIARFLMNVLLASGGYPWTIIRVEDRAAYLAALDAASVDDDLVPFTSFIADCATNAPDAQT